MKKVSHDTHRVEKSATEVECKLRYIWFHIYIKEPSDCCNGRFVENHSWLG